MYKNILTSVVIVVTAFCLPKGTQAQSQNDIDTVSFKVMGVCDECKARIENAAYIKGVKSAEWDKFSKQLTLIYRTDKTTVEDVQRSVANAGHETDAGLDTSAYQLLPRCCQYNGDAQTH